MVTAIFPAAGQGRRMKAGINKVFLELAGRPILVRTLLRFSSCTSVDRLVVVVADDETVPIERMLHNVSGLKPYVVVAGGSERQYSVFNGLNAMDFATDIVLVHDAARPMVRAEIIEDVIIEARRSGAAIAAVKEKNTVKVVNADGVVKKTPARAGLWEIQTPQGFRKDILIKAYQKAAQDAFLGTDDASLVERLGIPVKVVQSDYRNIKVTTPEDLLVAEAFLREEGLHKAEDSLKTAISSISANFRDGLYKMRKER